MGINKNFQIKIYSTSSKPVEAKLKQASKPSEIDITIGNIGYQLIGKKKAIQQIKSHLKQRDFKTIGELREISQVATNQLLAPQKRPKVAKSRQQGQIISGTIGKALNKYLEKLPKQLYFSGSVLIQSQGKIVLSKGYGQATSSEPNTPKTVFEIASTTKQFTAAAILRLVHEGKIHLDDKISEYLPEELYSERWDDITVRNLLNHSSRIKNNFKCKQFFIAKNLAKEQKRPFTPSKEELISYFINEPLRSEDDPSRPYSNNNYYLLGAILENITEKPYAQIIQEMCHKKMPSIGYYNPNPSPEKAIGNERTEKGLTPAKETVAAEAYAAGGLHSTTEDLSLWWDELLGGKIVSNNPPSYLLDKMLTASNGEFSLGLEVETIQGEKALRAGGELPGGGFRSEMCQLLESNTRVILLLNNFDFPLETIRNSLISILKGGTAPEFVSDTKNFPDGQYFDNPEEGHPLHLFSYKNGRYTVTYEGKTETLLPLSNGQYVNQKHGTVWEFDDNKATCYRPNRTTIVGILQRTFKARL